VPAIDGILANSPRTRAMADKLKRAGRRSRYRLRKQVVEPVFRQIKQARGFRQCLLRGFAKVRQEWALICAVHNLVKFARYAAARSSGSDQGHLPSAHHPETQNPRLTRTSS
jgi:hypothetical protein